MLLANYFYKNPSKQLNLLHDCVGCHNYVSDSSPSSPHYQLYHQAEAHAHDEEGGGGCGVAATTTVSTTLRALVGGVGSAGRTYIRWVAWC